MPFSDPVADGPVIQRASERALRHGTNLAGVLDVARQIRRQSDAGLIIFSYLNPILQFGLEKFCVAAAEAGVDGALVTDLPVEEAGDYLRAMKAHKLAPVFLAAPTSTDQRLRGHRQAFARIRVCHLAHWHHRNTTGIWRAMRGLWSRALRAFTKLPIAVGFGISTAEQFAEVGSFADAAVVGSAIVQRIEQKPGTRSRCCVRILVFPHRNRANHCGQQLGCNRNHTKPRDGWAMDIADWRKKIDDLDSKLVRLLNERAECAHEIGKLKRNSAMPIYEPDREKIIYENIARQNSGPLSDMQLRQVYERLIDVMRQIQRDEMAPEERQRTE